MLPHKALKRVLVTGANKGIGKAVCEQILKEFDDTYVLLGSRDVNRGQDAVNNILQNLGEEYISRIEPIQLDVCEPDSVNRAAMAVSHKFSSESHPLYGIINNAGIGFGYTIQEIIDTNFLGTKRVCDAFIPLIHQGGRVVNIASASGPNFLSRANEEDNQLFTNSHTTFEKLDQRIMRQISMDINDDAYGFSKACVNIYTIQLAQVYSELSINSCTPGFILTDITRGMGATKPPEAGTKAPLYCLFGENVGTGKYFGSDAVRSPLDRYRNPGDPPYDPFPTL